MYAGWRSSTLFRPTILLISLRYNTLNYNITMYNKTHIKRLVICFHKFICSKLFSYIKSAKHLEAEGLYYLCWLGFRGFSFWNTHRTNGLYFKIKSHKGRAKPENCLSMSGIDLKLHVTYVNNIIQLNWFYQVFKIVYCIRARVFVVSSAGYYFLSYTMPLDCWMRWYLCNFFFVRIRNRLKDFV